MKNGFGLALGSGSVKGFAHIGVLKVLEKYNVRPDVIAGTSAGALFGAAYASGINAKELEKIILKINWQNMLDFTYPKKGIMFGDKLENMLYKLYKGKYFDELDIPFYCTAVDINEGRLIVFDSGDVTTAVRASISLPGFFVPVEYGGMELIDGGILDPVPVDILKKRGIKKVLAVKLGKDEKELTVRAKTKFMKDMRKIFIKQEIDEINRMVESEEIRLPLILQALINFKKLTTFAENMNTESPGPLDVLGRATRLRNCRLEKLSLQGADLVLAPKFKGIADVEFDKIREIIKQGEKVTEKEIKNIKKLCKH